MRMHTVVVTAAVLATAGLVPLDLTPSHATAQTTQPAARPTSPRAAYDADLAAFEKNVATLAPNEAATQWLALFDRLESFPRRGTANTDYEYDESDVAADPDHADLLAALPPPAAWDALAKAIDARPTPAAGDKLSMRDRRAAIRVQALKLLAASLRNDQSAQKSLVADLQSRVTGIASAYRTQLEPSLEALRSFTGLEEDPTAVLDRLEEQLKEASGSYSRWYTQTIYAEDLVKQVGKERAETFLRKGLIAPVMLSVEAETETADLAQSLAMELIDQLKRPQWSLVNDANAIELFEALEARFGPDVKKEASTQPATAPTTRPRRGLIGSLFGGEEKVETEETHVPDDSYARSNAAGQYQLGLLLADRLDELKLFSKAERDRKSDRYNSRGALPYDATEQIRRAGKTKQVIDTLAKLLESDPDWNGWTTLKSLAEETGELPRVTALAKSAMDKPDLSDELRQRLRDQVCNALIADGKLAEAAAMLEKDMAARRIERDHSTANSLANKLALLGKVEGNDAWRDAGLKLMIDAANGSTEVDWYATRNALNATRVLERADRAPEAVALLAGMIARDREHRVAEVDDPALVDFSDGNLLRLASELIAIYSRADAHEEVIELLETMPEFGLRDFSEMIEQTDEDEAPIAYYVAKALQSVGRPQDAARVLDALLDTGTTYDPAFALRIALGNAEPILDRRVAISPLDERPLVWKAKIALDRNNLDEAERLARKAIAIDPADDDHPVHRQLTAWSVLSDVLNAKGDSDEAKRCSDIDRALRIGEAASELLDNGFAFHAIAEYERAIGSSRDFFCNHARLADQFLKLGKLEEANARYQVACETMAASFGRASDHCFQCDNIFDTDAFRSAADTYFTLLAADRPNAQPQVHYLLGYLRYQQQRYDDARKAFHDAARIDPDYFNAWQQLFSTASLGESSQEDKNLAGLAMFRLDPMNQYSGQQGLPAVTDLRALWNIAEQVTITQPAAATDLFPLKGSIVHLDAAKLAREKQRKKTGEPAEEEAEAIAPTEVTIQPGKMLCQTNLIKSISRLMAGM